MSNGFSAENARACPIWTAVVVNLRRIGNPPAAIESAPDQGADAGSDTTS